MSFPRWGMKVKSQLIFANAYIVTYTQYTTTATDTKKVKKMQRVIILFAPPSLIIIRMIPSVLAAVLDIWY